MQKSPRDSQLERSANNRKVLETSIELVRKRFAELEALFDLSKHDRFLTECKPRLKDVASQLRSTREMADALECPTLSKQVAQLEEFVKTRMLPLVKVFVQKTWGDKDEVFLELELSLENLKII